MLNNVYTTRAIAIFLLVVGGFLAFFNTSISAYIIAVKSGLPLLIGFSIAVGLTAVELWFASWARVVSHWKPLAKRLRIDPVRTGLMMVGVGLGLGLVYHFDVESTRLSVQSRATSDYFFLWGLSWLIFGPELCISLNGWLMHKSNQVEARSMKENNSRDADRTFLQNERRTMLDLAEEAGRQSAIAKMRERHKAITQR